MIPKITEINRPFLQEIANEKEHGMKTVKRRLQFRFRLTTNEVEQLKGNGKETVWNNRVEWSRTMLKMAGLVKNPKRGYVQITKLGLRVLYDPEVPNEIKESFLKKYKRFENSRRND